MVQGKANAANDMTIGQAETAHDLAVRIHLYAGGNPVGIWAYLLGTPARDQRRLMEAWGVDSLEKLSRAIAELEVRHVSP